MAKIKKIKNKKLVRKKEVAKVTPPKSLARNKVSSALVYNLKEVMDIAFASDFQSELSQIFSKKVVQISIDSSRVQRLTTPCVQVLISAAKTCEGKGVKFILSNPSEVVQKVFNDLGLSGQLSKWSK